MFDIGMTEMLVVGVVALIVVGPKDLPVMFRRVGQFVGKAKGMAREFSSAMNDAADDTGVREMASGLNSSLKAATNPVGAAMDGVKDAASSLTNFETESDTKLSAERQENVKRIQASTARSAAERKAREAKEAMQKADELEASLQETLAAKDASAATPAAVKPAAAKKPAAKKPAAKKPAAKTTAAKKAPAKKKAAK
ncbi:Sec-independent protein translocase protein TatB [Sulfitobacter sp.]|uniref:Sec-independent protein translocase protein TatB n=1 Tax=Sulfitobacter sp. TaxID=1903071 RepID=UPI00329866D1